jgi:hypothetical protein
MIQMNSCTYIVLMCPTQILSSIMKINNQQLFNFLTFKQLGPDTVTWGYLPGAQNSVYS